MKAPLCREKQTDTVNGNIIDSDAVHVVVAVVVVNSKKPSEGSNLTIELAADKTTKTGKEGREETGGHLPGERGESASAASTSAAVTCPLRRNKVQLTVLAHCLSSLQS